LRGEVGDTIRVVFKNNATHPYSLHPHGVFYNKSSEGALYEDGTTGADKADDAVPPGATYTYTWKVPERAGPGPNDPSSIVWGSGECRSKSRRCGIQ
jgi:FtsP/CotA-like multicopper oxidase with cupredoxin domain